MENRNNGLVIALAIFVIISIGLGGFVCYEKFINNDSKKESGTKSEISKSEKKDNTTETKTTIKEDYYQVLQLSPVGGIAVVYNGEVYVNIYDSTPNIDRIYGDGKFQTLINTRNNYKEYSFGNLTVTTKYINTGGSSTWLKLNTSDVKSIYNNEYGQALSSINPKYGIIMLYSDNTVSYIGMDNLIVGNNNPTKLDVSGVSNVVTEDKGGYTTYLVDLNNNKTNVNDYIK